MIWQAATIAGPAAGGALYALRARASDVYIACAALFSLATAFALATKDPSVRAVERHEGAIESVVEGLRFVRKRPVILESISLDLFAVLFGGATALLPIFASDVLRVGPIGLGALRSAPAVGATITAIVLARFPLRAHAGPIMLACVALFGAATIAFGASRSFPLSLAMLAVLGASDMISVVVRGAVVQHATPDAMRGRVSSVVTCSLSRCRTSSASSSRALPPRGSVRRSPVVAGGVGTIAIVALYTFSFARFAASVRLEGTNP